MVDSSTEYEHGSTAQLLTGTKIKVESHFDANGNLIADQIGFKQVSELEFAGSLEAVDTTGCGDVFHAGFIYGLIQAWKHEKSFDFDRWIVFASEFSIWWWP